MNPFLQYRQRLESYRLARRSGWSDARFADLVENLDQAVSEVQGHGFAVTPLHEANELATAAFKCQVPLLLKDDTGNVGGSHKARHLFGVLLHHAVTGQCSGELAIASCGNAALAAAILAQAVKRPIKVFIPEWADAGVVAQLRTLNAKVVFCERQQGEQGDPAYLRCLEAIDAGAQPFSCQSTMTPTTLDGGRTIGWELADQLITQSVKGRLELFIQVGGGALASAAWMGLCEGFAHHTEESEPGRPSIIAPVMRAVQTTACAPLDQAWGLLSRACSTPADRLALARSDPSQFMRPWPDVGMSAAAGIIDDVTYDWLPIIAALCESDG